MGREISSPEQWFSTEPEWAIETLVVSNRGTERLKCLHECVLTFRTSGAKGEASSVGPLFFRWILGRGGGRVPI